MGYPLLVAAALIERDGLVLLAQRLTDVPYPLFWEFPGGKVEPGEDPAQTIVREIKEELAAEVAVTGVYDVVYHRYPERTVLVIVYRCHWLAGEMSNVQVTDHCWVKPEALLDFNLLPADVSVAERLRRESGAGAAASP
jgi:8-oxo-dGTP diphosphatase